MVRNGLHFCLFYVCSSLELIHANMADCYIMPLPVVIQQGKLSQLRGDSCGLVQCSSVCGYQASITAYRHKTGVPLQGQLNRAAYFCEGSPLLLRSNRLRLLSLSRSA